MKVKRILSITILIGITTILYSCFDKSKYASKPYLRSMEIVKLSDKDYLHISYLKDDNGGYTPCNGYIRVEDNEAAVFDTPITDSMSLQLIDYIEKDLHAKIKAVVVSHHHRDAAGGLKAFVKAGIPSYASIEAAPRLISDSIQITHIISESEKFSLGTLEIENRFFGPAHSKGDIISYIAADSILYGGCAVKPVNGCKGSLADASPKEWASTIKKVKNEYPEARLVIPGHGATGDSSLLDYTVELFTE